MNLLKKLYTFQKERFPLQILTFTTLSSVLASASVCQTNVKVANVGTAFIIVTLLLFHIRAIDESRDFRNDSKLHPDRPVQRGLIKINTLFWVSIAGLLCSVVLAYLSGITTLIFTFGFIAFTTLAWRDFFMPTFFDGKPTLYHIVNSPQMILVQFIIFSVFTKSVALTTPMLLFLLLTYNNIFILEVIRKVKPAEIDTKDTYSSKMGIPKSLLFVGSMYILGYIIYLFIFRINSSSSVLPILLGIVPFALGILSLFLFGKHRSNKNQQATELAAVLFYVLLNTLIFFSF